MIDRVHKELTENDIAEITSTYHNWRSVNAAQDNKTYQDTPGYCKSASLEEIRKNDYVLTPGRYVGIAEEEDDGLLFEDKMKELSKTLFTQMEEAKELDAAIKDNLKVLGYE